MNFQSLILAALVAVGVPACSHSDATMMSEYVQDLERHLEALRREQSSHSSEVASASDLDTVRATETSHQQRMDDHMNRMGMVVGDMGACNDRRSLFDHAAFARMMQDMRAECDEHHALMSGAADLEAVRTEESRHQDVMQRRLDAMRAPLGTMMRPGNDYACSHCRHCGM